MKQLALTLIIAVAATFSPSVSAKKKKIRTVTAKINRKCQVKYAYITVPKGRVATHFTLRKLSAGYNCRTNARMTQKGFTIKKGFRTKLRYYRNSKGAVHQKYSTLKKLRLGPGTYSIIVDGGRKASVTLQYKM